MWIESVALFLAISLLFYCLFAGADFGAGILEAFRGDEKRREQREVITHAISPVWEANHVWLILAVVILFVGFPQAYARLSVIFHIPLTIMLLGIVLRGCAFTFRHYDVIKDKSQDYYSIFFVISSFLTPFMLGTVAGAVFLGRLPARSVSFVEVYIEPWANLFSFSVGVFTCVLFAFLAAVYLIGETRDPELREVFKRRARVANGAAVLTGVLVFMAAELDSLPLLYLFARDPWSLGCMIAATLLLFPLWVGIETGRVQIIRGLVASQVGLVLLGWFKLQFPALIVSRVEAAHSVTIYTAAAPETTLRFLLYALVIGSLIIFPALIYLLVVFKRTRLA